MASRFYASIKTADGTDLTSEAGISENEHPNESVCHKIDHEIFYKTHPDNGKITDATAYNKVLTITKEIDRATPGLYDALLQSKDLNVVLTFERAKKDGTAGNENYYWIALERARIVSIVPRNDRTQPSPPGQEGIELPPLEDASIRYEKITWEHMDAPAAVAYDFQNRGAASPFDFSDFK